MEELPLIMLPGLEGHDPASLTPLQSALLPYVPGIELVLWALWVGTLAFVLLRHVVIPLVRK